MSCFLQWMLSASFLLAASGAMAEEEIVRPHKQVQELPEQMNQTQRHYERKINKLEQRILELEKVANPDSGDHPPSIADVRDSDKHHLAQSPLKWSMSGLVAMGGTSASRSELQQLQAGSHDPRKNGFTTQALALAVNARLDHHFNAAASIVSHIEPDGENVVELEQAFIKATDLPYDLSVMVGQYFLDFGKENTKHPDDWDFVDVQFLIARLFGGDKLRSQGIQLAWQFPWSSRSTFSLGASNPSGETVTGFLYKEGEVGSGWSCVTGS